MALAPTDRALQVSPLPWKVTDVAQTVAPVTRSVAAIPRRCESGSGPAAYRRPPATVTCSTALVVRSARKDGNSSGCSVVSVALLRVCPRSWPASGQSCGRVICHGSTASAVRPVASSTCSDSDPEPGAPGVPATRPVPSSKVRPVGGVPPVWVQV